MKDYDFHVIGDAVSSRINTFLAMVKEKKGILVQSDVDRHELYDVYLKSFPEGTNPIFRERTTHDCTCCRHFIHNAGRMALITPDNQIHTIWEGEVEGYYGVVAAAMDSFVRTGNFNNVYSINQSVGRIVGSKPTVDGKDITIKHSHFYHGMPAEYVMDGTKRGEIENRVGTVSRVAAEFDVDSVETVLELIKGGAIYRGDQYRVAVERTIAFLRDPSKYHILKEALDRYSAVANIRNSSIGQLIVKYIETGDIDVAVRQFEAMTAPSNYRRTTAVVTKGMIEKARATVDELGYGASMNRRLAVFSDIPVTAVSFVNNHSELAPSDPFDSLMGDVKEKVNLDKATPISFEAFQRDILPSAHNLEMMVDHAMANRVVTMTAPVDKDAPSMMKWANGFGWAYRGDATDSIKHRVKAAGGKVDGDVRISLGWYDYDDLDLHLHGPRCTHVYFGIRSSQGSNIKLDVDMNISADTQEPVENIVFNSLREAYNGDYEIIVNNYTRRSSAQDFDIEFEFGGKVHHLSFKGSIRHGDSICVIKFNIKDGVITLQKPNNRVTMGEGRSVDVCGVPSGSFAKVQYIMDSPNYWDDPNGLRHTFFFLEGMRTDEPVRPFFNEFLKDELYTSRKVFEMLGSNMMIPTEGKDQLTGIGINCHDGAELWFRVEGPKTSRIYKVTI